MIVNLLRATFIFDVDVWTQNPQDFPLSFPYSIDHEIEYLPVVNAQVIIL